VKVPVRVQFHAVGHNVAHPGGQAPDTGPFRLTVVRPGKPAKVLDFRGGQTQVWLNPPKGDDSSSSTWSATRMRNAWLASRRRRPWLCPLRRCKPPPGGSRTQRPQGERKDTEGNQETFRTHLF
jgi:hypothetical protein